MIKHNYLIIGCPRSGTTLIHLLLKGHPNVAALNDELRITPFFTQGIGTFTFGNDLLEERHCGYSVLFNTLASITANKDTTAIGAKCVCHSPTQAQAIMGVIPKYINNLKIILLIRKDLVAQYGSMLNARKTGIYHSWYANFGKEKSRAVTINKWLFIRYAIKCLDTLNVLKELQKTNRVLECVYEDYISAPEKIHEQLFSFLEISRDDVTWLESKKIMPDPMKYIKNYADMQRVMENLRIEHAHGRISPIVKSFSKVMSYLLIYRSVSLKFGYLAIKQFLKP